jgi:hypothetical protein
VKDPVTLSNQAVNQRGVGDVALEETESGMSLERAKVLEAAGGEVVECPDLRAAIQHRFAEVRPDETCTPCDEDSHALSSHLVWFWNWNPDGVSAALPTIHSSKTMRENAQRRCTVLMRKWRK